MLAISLLGQPLFKLDGVPVTGFVSQKASALLAYLAVESNQPHGRDTIAEIFWPEQSDGVARKNLRDVLFNLQKLLNNQSTNPPYLVITRQTVQFNQESAHRLDVTTFAELIAASESHRHKKTETCRSCTQRLEIAITLYRGNFLAGTYINGSVIFENWQALSRERWRQMALAGLMHLTRFYARRQAFSPARRYAQRQIELAPWLEMGYRQLMALSALTGQRGAALAQFEICRQRLSAELDVSPGPETIALYEQIKAGQTPLQISSLSIIRPLCQIPTQTTSFLGREEEQNEIADFLQDPECRLLTLIGPGGSGKTRLAIQVAVDEATNYEHGVFFVPLAAVESWASFPLALAEKLNLSLSGNKSPDEQVLNYLREKELMLVLDNFESLLGNGRTSHSPDLLLDILQTAPRVTMFVTSRQPIGLQAERLFDLDGLSYPDIALKNDFERCESVQLFLERARRLRPKFRPESQSLAAIAAICRLAEGLPLGIELAAAGVREMTSLEILEAMQQSLDAMTTNRPDVPSRHRSLRATFAYSWEMLSPNERHAFCDLSVFRGGFVAEAAATEIQTLSALVEKSLLRREEDGRYQMHELLRQFGEEKLRQNPQTERAARDHHSAWVAGFLQKRGPLLKGEEQLAALTQIRNEIENVRAGWNWTIAQQNEAEILQALAGLTQFYDLSGWFQEGLEMMRKTVTAVSQASVLYGRILSYQAAFAYRIGQYDQAHAFFQQSLTHFHQQNVADEAAFSLNGLGAIAAFRGQYDEAQRYTKESLTISQKTDDFYEQAKSYDLLGVIARYEGRLADAKPFFQASVRLYEKMGNQFGLARSYNYLGNAAVTEEAYEEALTMFDTAMNISRALDYKFLMAYLLNNLGNISVYLNEHQKASDYFQESLILFKDMGDQFGLAMVQDNLGHVNLVKGENEAAEKQFRAAIQSGLDMQSWSLVLDALTGMAILRANSGKKIGALELVTLILRHSATRKETKQKAEPLSAKLIDGLSQEEAAAAQANGKSLVLTDVIADILETNGKTDLGLSS